MENVLARIGVADDIRKIGIPLFEFLVFIIKELKGEFR